MSEVIVITSGKGGVGKTTTTANVGTGLAQLNKKVVLIDTDIGLRNARINFRQIEENHTMENIIFNELVNRDLNVDVGLVNVVQNDKNGNPIRKQLEVDFVCNKGSKRYYVQSAFAIPDSEKMAQESNSLLRIDDSFKKIIVVKDTPAPWYTEKGILVIGIYDFLLRADSLDI